MCMYVYFSFFQICLEIQVCLLGSCHGTEIDNTSNQRNVSAWPCCTNDRCRIEKFQGNPNNW